MRYSTGHACESGVRFTGGTLSSPGATMEQTSKIQTPVNYVRRDVIGGLRFNHSEAAKNDSLVEWKSWHVGNPDDAAFCIREKLNKAHLLI